MSMDWQRYLRSGIATFLWGTIACAEEPAKKPEGPSVAPKVPERQFVVPAIRAPDATRPKPVTDLGTRSNADVASRLSLVIKEVRRLEIRSLDPNPAVEGEPGKGLGSFHDFRTIGRKELGNKEAIHDLLHSVVLAIARGPEETYECFEPRHGLRIYTAKG
jgi:hypothetical protein